ncbi:MAG: type VI secretion system tube protein Hcp [Nitrosopumilus sp.]|nr:type VI secretion system tube protein Hcp [Nitrosopumilus sp.]
MKFTILFAAVLGFSLVAMSASDAYGAIYVKIPDIPGDVTAQGYDDKKWFDADSFSFGVERELTESGEKGGTADINIGEGELQEVSISKSLDSATSKLFLGSVTGNSHGNVQIDFVQTKQFGEQQVFLQYCLGNTFVKSWSTSGDADDRPTEEVSFYYNKIAFQYTSTDGQVIKTEPPVGWDNVKNIAHNQWDCGN